MNTSTQNTVEPHEPAGIARTQHTYANYLSMSSEELADFLIWNDINGVYRTQEAQQELRQETIHVLRSIVCDMIEGES